MVVLMMSWIAAPYRVRGRNDRLRKVGKREEIVIRQRWEIRGLPLMRWTTVQTRAGGMATGKGTLG